MYISTTNFVGTYEKIEVGSDKTVSIWSHIRIVPIIFTCDASIYLKPYYKRNKVFFVANLSATFPLWELLLLAYQPYA